MASQLIVNLFLDCAFLAAFVSTLTASARQNCDRIAHFTRDDLETEKPLQLTLYHVELMRSRKTDALKDGIANVKKTYPSVSAMLLHRAADRKLIRHERIVNI